MPHRDAFPQIASALDDVLLAAVDAGAVPHVVAVVADRDGIVYEGSAGELGGRPPTARTPFQIKSMTKLVTSVLALQLAERGHLDLDTPVRSLLPEFADLQVLDGFDGDTPRLRPPATEATVRHLSAQTVGSGYWFWYADIRRYEKLTGQPNVGSGDPAVFRAPLLADPGTRWIYGTGHDWLGRVVEAVTGTSLDTALEQHLTGPLGMSDTAFVLDESRQAAASPLHVPGPDGTWAAVGHALIERPWSSGGDGLHSTPRDHARFQRALLRGGELDGTRILSPAGVEEVFTSQIGDAAVPPEIPTTEPGITATFRPGPGRTWGHGLLLNVDDVPGGRRAGSGGWYGLFNTAFWIDRTSGVSAAVYTSTLPFVAEGAWTLFTGVEEALYASL
jgi:methyl acetate hydrolase